MCLSGDPFVPKMGAVMAKESCGFVLEKRPPDPWVRSIWGNRNFNRIWRTCQIKHLCLPKTVFRFFLDSNDSNGNLNKIWYLKTNDYDRDCRETLTTTIWCFSYTCNLLNFNDTKMVETRLFAFFDSLIRSQKSALIQSLTPKQGFSTPKIRFPPIDSPKLALYIARKDGITKKDSYEEKPGTGDGDIDYGLEGVKGRPLYHTVP